MLEHHESTILILPAEGEKLPNPTHFALGTDNPIYFQRLLQNAQDLKLEPRSGPTFESQSGMAPFTRNGKNYNHFYVFDPTRVIVEILIKV